jgi:hypothetical protein
MDRSCRAPTDLHCYRARGGDSTFLKWSAYGFINAVSNVGGILGPIVTAALAGYPSSDFR